MEQILYAVTRTSSDHVAYNFLFLYRFYFVVGAHCLNLFYCLDEQGFQVQGLFQFKVHIFANLFFFGIFTHLIGLYVNLFQVGVHNYC
jgi:hypothetical protein